VPRRLLSSLSFGFTLAGLVGGGAAAAGTPPALLHPTLVLGAAVPVPAGFKAGESGAEWALPGGARVTADAGAELRVLGVAQQLDLGARRQVKSYTVVLTAGVVRLSVPQSGDTAVLVSAPHKTSVIVAGGEAGVSAGPRVAVANAEGTTSVAFEGSRFHVLTPGQVEVAGMPKHALPGSPVLAASPSVLLSYGEPAALQALRWDAVPGAHAYRVDVRDASSRSVAHTETQATALPAGFALLEPGAYSIRLAAVDAAGFESAHAQTRAVSVLGMRLPAGVFLDPSGVVRYSPGGAAVAFEHADAVEMGFGGSDTFAPAPSALGLFRTQPFVVRFRAGAEGAAQELWFSPRTTHATIAFGPRVPSWPGKALEIDVRVEGASAPSEWADAEPSVTVGVEPVAVKFTRDGARMHGVLPAAVGKGPWVVRVEVKDKRGVSLGRDFVEIAASEAKRAGGS
jgi:hypothetical protein